MIGVHHEPAAIGFSSRYLTAKLLIDREPEKALALLEGLGRDGGGMLIPTNDEFLILVARNHGRLSEHFTVAAPPWERLGPLMDVARCYELAREVGIRTPRFLKPATEQEMKRIVASLDVDHNEYLLKTMPGSTPADPLTGRFSKVAGADRETIESECLAIYQRAREFPVIVEIVAGTADRCLGVCMVVDQDHEAVLWYSVRRLRLHTYSRGGRFVHPYEMGANVYCESVHDDEAAEAARRLVRHARYQGPIAVEFRRDPADESLVLIKADPRFVRATSLSASIGLDLPTAVYRSFSGQPAVRGSSYSDGVAWIWLTAYLETLWKSRSERPLRRELVHLMKNFHRIKAVAYLDVRDPWPFLVSVYDSWKNWWKPRIERLRRGLGSRRRALG